MAADPKQELHMLIDQLDGTQTQDALVYVRQRLQRQARQGGQAHTLPMLHRAPAITSIDELHVPLFSPDESSDDFDATLRRWREVPESA